MPKANRSTLSPLTEGPLGKQRRLARGPVPEDRGPDGPQQRTLGRRSTRRYTVHKEEGHWVPAVPPPHRVFTTLVAHDILVHVAECLLESGSPQPYVFEGEALGCAEYTWMEDLTRGARKDLAKMCLVHSSWFASAQRVLQRRVVLRSFRGVDTLKSSKHLSRRVKTLRFGMGFGESKVQPLTSLIRRTISLRILSIDLHNFKPRRRGLPPMASLATAIGQLSCLEGLIVSNISIPIAQAFLKPLLFGTRDLHELRYIGLGFNLDRYLWRSPLLFSPTEVAEYHSPPKLNTVAFWTDHTSIPGRFLDHLRDWGHSPESGPDIFELKRDSFRTAGLSHLVTTFVELFKARRLYVVGVRDDQSLSATIEELFVEFTSEVSRSAGEQLYDLVSSGKLPKLRSIKVSSRFREEGDEFERAREVCTSKGCSFETFIRFMDMRYIDELLFHARSFEW